MRARSRTPALGSSLFGDCGHWSSLTWIGYIGRLPSIIEVGLQPYQVLDIAPHLGQEHGWPLRYPIRLSTGGMRRDGVPTGSARSVNAEIVGRMNKAVQAVTEGQCPADLFLQLI
jgi:hypothetical protein